jgi:hypothetical protein
MNPYTLTNAQMDALNRTLREHREQAIALGILSNHSTFDLQAAVNALL